MAGANFLHCLSFIVWQSLAQIGTWLTNSISFAAAIEDSSIDFGDFFKGPLPGKFLKLLGYLALSRLGIYVPLGGVNREAFAGNLDQNSLLSTLDSFSGGGIGRLGICSLGIVPFINAQIVFQLLAQIYPKLQDLQKREGEAGRKKILQYTRYASVGFALVQASTWLTGTQNYINHCQSKITACVKRICGFFGFWFLFHSRLRIWIFTHNSLLSQISCTNVC